MTFSYTYNKINSRIYVLVRLPESIELSEQNCKAARRRRNYTKIMITAKRIFTHIFVAIVNFYLLTFFIGLFLMLVTVFAGPLNIWLSFAMVILSLLTCITYQATRNKWHISTIGETIIGNSNSSQILEQSKLFTITRIPLFILIILTLGLNGNLQDGLSEGKTFSIGAVISLGLLFSCTYYGLKNFFTKPEMLPVLLISGGLLLVGFGFKVSPNAPQTGDFMFKLESRLAIAWVAAGLIYKFKATRYSLRDNHTA